MQTLDVQLQNPAINPGSNAVKGGKTGAETARNGSSFLAMIEKMIAGTMEGASDPKGLSAAKMAVRGAGDGEAVPGEGDTLIKPGSGKQSILASNKKNLKTVPAFQAGGEKAVISAEAKPVTGDKTAASRADKLKLTHAAPGTPEKDETGALSLSPQKDSDSAAEKTGKPAKSAEPDGSCLALMQKGAEALPADGTVPDLLGDKKGALSPGDDGIAEKPAPVSTRKDRKTFISVRDDRTDGTENIPGGSPLAKSTELHDDNTADMTIGFRSAENGRSTADETMQLSERHDREGQSFQSMLSQELKNNAADFVKTGQIVLRDNNAGLIRLTLHPESLGNVKISLELSGDRKVSGKIVVSSQEAYDAFNENLEGLSDAFVQGGFESAGFDLSWSGPEGGGRSGRDGTEAAAITPFYASSIPDVISGSESSDRVIGGSARNAMSAIDVFA